MTKKLNAVGQERKFWGTLPLAPAKQLMEMGRQMEDTGFEGAFMLQIYGPPFAALAAVAAGTTRLKVATGVAVESSRTPFETAFIAMDMDRITEGRFVLGLGASLPATTVGMHGLPNYKPIAHLKDTVAAIRHIVAGSHKGLQPYEGEYYKADYKEMIVMPPPVREHIPIWIGALREKMTRTALEIGDGLLGHSLWSTQFTNEYIGPLIERSLKEFGRSREDIEVSSWPFVAVNDDKQQAIEDARATVAYYAGMKAYEYIFEAQGYLEQARLCQDAASRQSDIDSVLDRISDQMVMDFVACGSPEDVLEQIEPFWNVADALCPTIPFRNLTMEQMQLYGQGIYRLVAAARQ
jgi:alkanesulfonate monooxygenase SsuD/methylene tetrahydromethanopterin reductase-like flavin-dependent oxidoreductase (luciferase family)